MTNRRLIKTVCNLLRLIMIYNKNKFQEAFVQTQIRIFIRGINFRPICKFCKNGYNRTFLLLTENVLQNSSQVKIQKFTLTFQPTIERTHSRVFARHTSKT